MNQIIEDIRTSESINQDKSFYYCQICSKLLRNPTEENNARKIIINILDNWHKLDDSTYELWTDLIESAGFYPYLEKEKNKLIFNNTAGEIRKEFHKSSNLKNKYFHEEQKIIYDILNSKKNLIVSAPTSFGKSLLIEEIVAAKKYKNIVVIQPTLALIDETRKKVKKDGTDYKIIVRTSQKPSEEKKNLFLLTAERVMEYPDLPKIDFFVIDEFYKLSAKRDDERSDVLNNAFNLLINKHISKFYLLGPNIDGISEGFADKYNAKFYKTNYSLVDNIVIDIYSNYETQFGERGKKKKFKEEKLFELLIKLKNEQTIIYCSSPSRVRYLSVKFHDYLINNNISRHNEELSIVEWIKENVSNSWSVIDCLNYRIGIHDGALQKHITSSIINYFNEKKLSYLFCTTTIIEGVNTSAKNIVFFDKKKGNRIPIDFFDHSNIKGRSGRFMEHYIGRIFNFNKPPEKENITIDIPFFEQNPISNEILIQLDKKDVKNKESNQYKKLEQMPPEEKEILKKNGILINGQKEILNYLKNNIQETQSLICWDAYPDYNQLKFVLFLAWDHLLKVGETTSPMTKAKLVKNTFDYGIEKNISFLIKSNYSYFRELSRYKGKTDKEVLDEAIRDAFQILKHWFHYKVPKWLNVINELQKYVCIKNSLKPGDYTFYGTQIENDFIRKNLSILAEYGIPNSAIIKLENKISANLNEDYIFEEIKNNNLIEISNLNKYEKEKIIENF